MIVVHGIESWQAELMQAMGETGPVKADGSLAIAYSLTLIAEKLGELSFNNGSTTTPGIGEKIAMVLEEKSVDMSGIDRIASILEWLVDDANLRQIMDAIRGS